MLLPSIAFWQYGPAGHRVGMDDGVDVTWIIYDGNNELQETDDVGVVEAEFTYIPAAYAQMTGCPDRCGRANLQTIVT